MKKAFICLLLMFAAVFAFEPHVRGKILDSAYSLFRETGINRELSEETPTFSHQMGSRPVTDMLDVTLYFRFENTQALGAQRMQLDIRREETVATRIVQCLIDGPAVSHEKLHGLFSQGTEVISVSGEDTTAFVTLSTGFLGRPDGAPQDWEDSFAWQEEAALRRRLAVQSIVLALTEGGRYQRVQMYVAQSDDDIPQRIPMVYFDPYVSDPSLVLAACPRDEHIMLTPEKTMNMILEAWKARDLSALYAFVGPAPQSELSTQSVFEDRINQWDISLLSYSTSTGTVSIDGQTATVVVDAQIRSSEGGDAQIIRESVPLKRLRDNWVIEEDTLQSLMIRD
ncbi:MAG: GerMN domain-containing protein [Clostridia bacterium]|nr:GerMN domain-containing protein [Clostridia bacterium]